MTTTGRELRTLRTLSGVTVNDLVKAIGLSRTTVWSIERQAVVKPETAAKYRDAIARLMQSAA